MIHGERVPVSDSSGPTVFTTSVPVSAQMAPSFRLVVYHVTDAGELVTDSVQVPVEGINRGRVSHVIRLCVYARERDAEGRNVHGKRIYLSVVVQLGIRDLYLDKVAADCLQGSVN